MHPCHALAGRLDRCGPIPSAVVGFDGFIDEMISVVGERRSPSDWSPLPTIADLARWTAAAAGRSALREIVVNRQDPGGCAINLGDGLAALDVAVDCFATLGSPPHPAFGAVTRRFRSTTSWGACHGRTLAFEFNDGKLMFPMVAQLAELDAALVRQATADGGFRRAAAEAGVLALVDWTLYPHMTGVWRELQGGALAGLTHRPRVFLDLVDPGSRPADDLREALEVARGFRALGPVTLGVNLNEANQLGSLWGLPAGSDEAAALERQAAELRTQLDLDEVVIHAVRHAASAEAAGSVSAPGWWCERPRKLTGAGDRFNAGCCLGHLLRLDARDRLLLGNAASGHFVRTGASADRKQLAVFLRAWAEAG